MALLLGTMMLFVFFFCLHPVFSQKHKRSESRFFVGGLSIDEFYRIVGCPFVDPCWYSLLQ